MDCVICKNGSTNPGFVTVTLENNRSVVIIRDVPAQVCINCGHYYLTDEHTEEVLSMAQESVRKGIEIEVTHFKVAS